MKTFALMFGRTVAGVAVIVLMLTLAALWWALDQLEVDTCTKSE